MQNPFISNNKNLFYYILLWAVIATVHILYIIRNYDFGLSISISDGLFFNFSFALLGLGLWYLIKYSVWDERDNIQVIVNLFLGALVIISLWIGFNELILRLIFSESIDYHNFLKSFRFWRISLAVFYYILIILIYYVIIYYVRLQEKKSAEIELKRNITEARLNLIRNQVNPHFLFNSLNSISSLTLSDAAKARSMIGRLSNFLRNSLSHEPNSLISLDEELKNCSEYLEIERVRFSEKFVFKFNLPSDLRSVLIPNMLLQPIFENAIKHGVQENTGNTDLICEIKKINNSVQILVKNTLEEKSNSRKTGTSFGQKNIKERLSLIYNGKANCSFRIENNLYIAEINLPIHYHKDSIRSESPSLS
ncbi:MAG: histidine kinase [Cytophagales bacterium]